MTFPDRSADGAYHIRLANRPADTLGSTSPIAALRNYLEQCDARSIAPESHLHLSAADRLTRDDIVTALPLCINIIRAGTTLVLPSGEMFGRDVGQARCRLMTHLRDAKTGIDARYLQA